MFLGLVFAGSAAVAVPTPGAGILSRERDTAELREHLRAQFERSLTGLELPAPGPAPAATTTAVSSTDPFSALAAGQFAAYASATVNHTGAPLSEGLGNDINLASAHAAHAGSALPPWRSEVGREAFPAMPAGTSIAKALAAEIGPAGGDEDDSQLPLDPAIAKAPPTSTPVVEDNAALDLPPALRNRSLRAEASARALRSGCVLGSDLAYSQANADETEIGDLKNDERSPEPFLSVNAATPQRALAQSLARARLLPIGGQASRFAVLAETRQTIAPVTLFKGDNLREITIEVAGEWILRAIADGGAGSVTLGVEKAIDDNRPLLRIISRDNQGRPTVTAIGDLDELAALDQGGIQFGQGLELVLAESPRSLRAGTGTEALATGTRAAGAVDILRIQTGEDPEDAIARIGHMEAAVAVPADGVTCPGIGVSKRSSQPGVDAGGRFSWVIDVSNPNDCVLDKINLVDTTQPSKGLSYRVVATSPTAKVSGDTVTFDGLGPIQPGGTRTLRIDVEVDLGSPAGRFTNQAVANGLCGSAALTGESEDETEVEPPAPLGLIGRAGADEPVVRTREARTAQGSGGALPSADVVVRPAPLSSDALTRTSSAAIIRSESSRPGAGVLARTGGPTAAVLGAVPLALGLLLRRFRPRR